MKNFIIGALLSVIVLGTLYGIHTVNKADAADQHRCYAWGKNADHRNCLNNDTPRIAGCRPGASSGRVTVWYCPYKSPW